MRSAPYIFNLFAEGLHWIIPQHIPGDIRHYLDDFLPIFSSTSLLTTSATVSWCQSLGKELGLIFLHEKTTLPCTCLEYLSLKIDTMSMEAQLLPNKLDYLQDILNSALGAHTVALWQLQELVGSL